MKKTLAAAAAFALLVCAGAYAFTAHTSTETIDADSWDGAFDDFSWDWSGYSDEKMDITFTPTNIVFSNTWFRMASKDRETITLKDLTGTATVTAQY